MTKKLVIKVENHSTFGGCVYLHDGEMVRKEYIRGEVQASDIVQEAGFLDDDDMMYWDVVERTDAVEFFKDLTHLLRKHGITKILPMTSRELAEQHLSDSPSTRGVAGIHFISEKTIPKRKQDKTKDEKSPGYIFIDCAFDNFEFD